MVAELPDINFNGKSEFVQFEKLFKDRHMSKGEVRLLFRLTDLNKDTKVDTNEWFNFYTLFIAPFEACDKDKDYYLNKEELG